MIFDGGFTTVGLLFLTGSLILKPSDMLMISRIIGRSGGRLVLLVRKARVSVAEFTEDEKFKGPAEAFYKTVGQFNNLRNDLAREFVHVRNFTNPNYRKPEAVNPVIVDGHQNEENSSSPSNLNDKPTQNQGLKTLYSPSSRAQSERSVVDDDDHHHHPSNWIAHSIEQHALHERYQKISRRMFKNGTEPESEKKADS